MFAKNLKKIFISFFVLIFSLNFSFAENFKIDFDQVKNNFDLQEFVLENGMHIFVLEDFSTPLVKVEYSVKAGFSNQTPQTSGFFSLYTNLFKNLTFDEKNILQDLESMCNADSSRYILNLSIDEFENALETLSRAAFSPIFKTSDIERELLALKKKVSENAISVEGFINASIDSRVFEKNPWAHDSGIYPAILKNQNVESSRLVLENISNNFYTPKNSALFICGPINCENVLQTVKKYFENENRNLKNQFIKTQQKKSEIENKIFNSKNNQIQKKVFVLSDERFTPEMTQIVVQYKNLSMEQADFAAAIFENENSFFKKSLLENAALKINNAQYINASSTHKNKSSRLIIQSLLESKNVLPEILDFVQTIKKSVDQISDDDFTNSKILLKNSFYDSIKNSYDFMNLISEFWALNDFGDLKNNFFSRIENLENESLENLKSNLNSEEPFVFVLLNSKIFEKNKKSFLKSGFEIVTTQNSSWYTNELYKTLKENFALETKLKNEQKTNFEKNNAHKKFIDETKNNFNNFELKNKIKVLTFEKQNTSKICFAINIFGGEIFDFFKGEKYFGVESVLVKAISFNFQNLLEQKFVEKKLNVLPEINVQTNFFNSTILIECFANDFKTVIETFSESLIFSDLQPALIDSIIMEEKSNQIVKTSSSVFQLYSNAIKTLSQNPKIDFAFTNEKNILQNISFNEFLKFYQEFFNAKKYNFVIVGNLKSAFESQEMLKNKLDECFEFLRFENEKEIDGNESDYKNDFVFEKNLPSKKTKKVKIEHLFLTDISREKAGPRPQVLIPTTEFFDPCQFWIPAENFLQSENVQQKNYAQFNAVLLAVVNYLQSEFNLKVNYNFATQEIPFGVITIYDVKNILRIENFYNRSITKILENVSDNNLDDLKNENQFIKKIKNNFIKNYFDFMTTNQSFAKSICDNFYKNDFSLNDENQLDKNQFDEKKEKIFFIQDYIQLEKFSESDLIQILENFKIEKIYKFYSSDTKSK